MRAKTTAVISSTSAGTAASTFRQDSTAVSHSLSNITRNATIVIQDFRSPVLIYPSEEYESPAEQSIPETIPGPGEKLSRFAL